MEIKVNFLDNLRLEAKFDDFTVIADQPIRYKGDGSAPGPFDYFLASSALCAAYFVKLYCQTRDIPTHNIRLSQNNIVDPENRYNQIFKIQVELPADLSEKDRQGILRSIERCTVKKVVQAGPEFVIEVVDSLDSDAQALLMPNAELQTATYIVGKDLPLEQTIANMSGLLADLGMKIEIASWRNIVPHVWSLHIRDAHSPLCFTNGKGATKESALASALGEFIERLNCNFFYNDQFWGEDIAQADLFTTLKSAGLSPEQMARYRLRFWMNIASPFTTQTTNSWAHTFTTPTPATPPGAFARYRLCASLMVK
jgi:ribosomal protein S12 methylthiotransferase accessory factor